MSVFKKMVEPIHHLHTQIGLAHLDIKLENYMVESSTGDIKLIDFGMAEQIDSFGNNIKGTVNYMPPEIQDHNRSYYHQGCSDQADIWSLGIGLFALAFGSMPFD